MTRRSKREIERALDDVGPARDVDRSQFELDDEERLMFELLFGSEKDPLDYYSAEEWERIQEDSEECQERWQGHTLADPPDDHNLPEHLVRNSP